LRRIAGQSRRRDGCPWRGFDLAACLLRPFSDFLLFERDTLFLYFRLLDHHVPRD
jgi:hypothetical protein